MGSAGLQIAHQVGRTRWRSACGAGSLVMGFPRALAPPVRIAEREKRRRGSIRGAAALAGNHSTRRLYELNENPRTSHGKLLRCARVNEADVFIGAAAE